RNDYTGQLLVDRVAFLRVLSRLLEKMLETRRIAALDHAEARLISHVVGHARPGRTVVEMHRRLARLGPAGIEPIERPHTGIDGHLLLRHAEGHVVAVRNAVAISDDQRRPV